MSTYAAPLSHDASHVAHPARVRVNPALTDRNRLTVAFRPLLALPHLLLVGGPLAATLSWWSATAGPDLAWGIGAGVFGTAAVTVALIAWCAVLFTGRYPPGL